MTPERDATRFKGRGTAVVSNHVVRDHMLLGGIVALLLSRVWPPMDCLIFWFATVLVDVDHYFNLLFWSDFRCFSVKKLMRFYGFILENKKKYPIFLAIEGFHTVEFMGVLFLIAYGWDVPLLKPVFWGISFHIFVDFFHLLRVGALRSRRNSFVEFFVLRSKAIRKGLDPTQVQKDAAASVMTDPARS